MRNPFSIICKEEDFHKAKGVITEESLKTEISLMNKLLDQPVMDIHTFICGPGKSIGFRAKNGWYRPEWSMSEEAYNAIISHLDPITRVASSFLYNLGLSDWYSYSLLKNKFVGSVVKNLRFVLLSLDRAYNEKGDVVRNHVYISPRDVVKMASLFPNKLYAGISIHPDNPKFYELLSTYAKKAVLMKYIPPSQLIDITEKRYESKWLEAAKTGLSFLVHTGHESATPNELQNMRLGHPRQLEPLLESCKQADKGGIVIAAHCGALGSNSGIPFKKDEYFRECLKMLKEYDNLYYDCSSLTGILRYNALKHIINLYRKGYDLPIKKMIFGTDQIALGRYAAEPTMFMSLGLTYDEGMIIRRVRDIFAKEILLLLYLGVPIEVFTRGYQLLTRRYK